VLLGLLAYRATGGSAAAALAATAVVVLSRPMLRAHAMALSEPAFLFFALLGVALLSSYLDGGKARMLVLAALAVALAWLARYVGVALVAAGALALLWPSGVAVRRRVAGCLVFVILASAPMAAWLVWNKLTVGSAAHRPLAWHPPTAAELKLGVWTVSTWLAPDGLPRGAKLAMLAALGLGLGAMAAAVARGGGSLDAPRVPRSAVVPVAALFVPLYLALVAAARTFFDAQVPFDTRNLLPAQICVVILIAAAVTAAWRRAGRAARRVLAWASLAVLAGTMCAAVPWVQITRADGLGYGARAWTQSGTAERLHALPMGVPVFTNDQFAVYYLSGRRAYGLPVRFDPMSNRPSPEFEPRMRALRDSLARGGNVLIYWRSKGPSCVATEEQILRRVGLVVTYEGEDGCIYWALPQEEPRRSGAPVAPASP
jgi:hypothetical protein